MRSNLGLWQPFINEPYQKWYELPSQLQRAVKAFEPSGSDLNPLPAAEWQRVKRRVMNYADQSVAAYKYPYHNEYHFLKVMRCGMQAIKKFEQLKRVTIPEAVKQAAEVALYDHDCHHCGASFRADALGALYRPGLGVKVSQEWVSVEAHDQLVAGLGFNAPSRLFQAMLIFCSTIGGQNPRAKSLNIPDVRPVSLWGWIIKTADVCTQTSDFQKECALDVAAIFGEISFNARPTTWQGYIDARLRFCDYVESCYDGLDKAAGVSLSAALGWRDNNKQIRRAVAQLTNRRSAEARILQGELKRYSVELPWG